MLTPGQPFTVKDLETETRPGRYHDGPNSNGLSNRIRVKSNNNLTKTFYWRGRIKGDDKEYKLGPFPIVSLKESRDIARDYYKLALENKDPRGQDAEEKPIPLLSIATESVIRIQDYTPRSRKPAEWRSTFRKYVIPVTGDKPISEFSRADVLNIIQPLWTDDTAKAKTLLRRLRTTFSLAVGQGHLDYNPADDAATAPLPPRHHISSNHASVDYRNIEDYISEMRALKTLDLALIEGLNFLILTAGRHREIFDLEWSDLHMIYEVFTPKDKAHHPFTFPCLVIPKERMKVKDRSHVIPLPTQALHILIRALAFRNRHPRKIFPTKLGATQSLSNTKRLRNAINTATGTAHGFRATIATWGQDHIVPDGLVETALAHKIKGVRGAYARSVLLSRRVYLMMDWADYNTGTFPSGYQWHERFVPEDPSTYPDAPSISSEEWTALDEASRENSAFTLFEDVQHAYSALRLSPDNQILTLPAQFMALTASTPLLVRRAMPSEIDIENATWNVPADHTSHSKQDFTVPLSATAHSIAARAQKGPCTSDLLFPSETGAEITLSRLSTLFDRLNLGITPMHFRAAFIIWCEEIGVDETIISELCGRKQPVPLAPIDTPDTTKTRVKLMKAWANFLACKLPADWRLSE